MGDPIQTQWHKLEEAMLDGRVALHAGHVNKGDPKFDPTLPRYNPDKIMLTVEDLEGVQDIIQAAQATPKFFLDRGLTELLDKDEVNRSLQDMHAAGLARLPFPELIVEWDHVRADNTTQRYFCILTERSSVAKPLDGEDGWHPWIAFLMRLAVLGGETRAVMSPSAIYVRFDAEAGEEKEFGFHYAARPAPFWQSFPDVLPKYMTDTIELEAHRIGDAIAAVVMLLHTKGVKKTVVSAPKLNKQRAKKQLPAVPDVTTLSIGMVYDKDGAGRAYTPTSGGRKTARVHWRRGHNKGVWHGPGKTLHKLTYIEPCLVNYIGNIEEAPVAKFRVKP